MLDKYLIDPTLNKKLIFAYQPSPEIDVSKLPILAKDWLDDLQKIICAETRELPKNIFDRHVGKNAEYFAKAPLLAYLKLIYHRLQGDLDLQLGALSANERLGIINKLTEEIKQCSEGFHNRVNIIVDSFFKPRNLAELLYTVRKKLVEEVASTLTNEIHAWNYVSAIAAKDGLVVKANFPDDPYSGALSVTSIRHALKQAFYEKFTSFNLPDLLIAAFRELIPELEREKNSENGIVWQTQEKIKKLIQVFLPDYINMETPNKGKDPKNWENYFTKHYNKNDLLFFSFNNLNWKKIRLSFCDALSKQNYFITPQINSLLDCAYYSLFIINNPFHVPSGFISKFFKEKRYSDLLEQLLELNTKFPNYYKTVSKNEIFRKNCLDFLDYLTKQLKISEGYSEEVLLGFQLILCLDLRRKKFIIREIANSLLVIKNQADFSLLMLAAQYNPTLANDILVFFETNRRTLKKIIDENFIENMFLMKNKDNSNALMIAASKQAEVISTILNFLAAHIGHFASDTLPKLFTQQQKDNYTAVSLTACNNPAWIKNILSFITDHIKIDGEILRKLLFSENSNGACTALMLAVKNQAEATYYFLKFIAENIRNFDPESLRKMLIEKDRDGFTMLMLAARYQPESLRFLLTFINDFDPLFPAESLPALFLEKTPGNNNCLMLASEFQPLSVSTILYFINQKIESHPKIFSPFLIRQLLLACDKNSVSTLMIAIRYQPKAVKLYLDFIQKHAEIFSPSFFNEFLLAHDQYGVNALMTAATYHCEVVELLLDFLVSNIKHFNSDAVYQFVFKKISDHAARFAGLWIKKSVLSVTTQLDDRTAIDALLRFVDDHIELIGIQTLIELLTEKDRRANYIFGTACSRYPLPMKGVLNFIAELPSFEELISIQPLLADFIFEQLARWPVISDDKSLFYSVTYNCSPLLLPYFNPYRFNTSIDNLEVVATILLCCLQSELKRKRNKELNQYFFFRLFSSTGSELQAAEDLEKTLKTASNKKEALMELGKQQSRFLKSNSILSCLFTTFQKVEDLNTAEEACEACEAYNDPRQFQHAMLV